MYLSVDKFLGDDIENSSVMIKFPFFNITKFFHDTFWDGDDDDDGWMDGVN